MTNTAGDWYFENLPQGTVNVATLPNGSASDVGAIDVSYPATATGQASINSGDSVTLTATGTNGSTVAWLAGGACDTVSGAAGSAQCIVNAMDAAKTATVPFRAPACTFSIAPTGAAFTKTGGRGSVTTTASSSSCQWTAQSNAQWVTLTAANYTGSAAVKYTVARNTSGAARTGVLTIAGQTFNVVQTK